MSHRVPLVAVLASLAVSPVLAVLVPPPAAAATPLVGLVDRARQPGFLARLDPKTLQRTSRKVKMRGFIWGFGHSPDGSQLAIGVSGRGFSLQIVDLRRWRTRRLVKLSKIGSAPSAVSWPRADRILALQGSPGKDGRNGVGVVDATSGRVLRRVAMPGNVMDARRTASGLVVLSSPRGRIGRAHVTIVDAEGGARTVVLGDVPAGFVAPPSNNLRKGEIPIFHEMIPALAVDTAGGRAFVVAAGRPVVDEVDLATATVIHHVVLAGGPATAGAAKAEEGMSRSAQWAGNELLAVTGQDSFLNHDDRQRTVSFGLQVVDTATWTIRKVASAPTWFVSAPPGFLLWSGTRYDPDSHKQTGGGLSTYALATGRRSHGLGKTSVSAMIWGGRYLYASVYRRHRTYVLDPASGRAVHVIPRAQPPLLLVD